jgi:gamma-glutamyltranspeptidase/glutathione hydrolase
MIASQHSLASDIGAKVLADGGNAVDAAVAAGLAIGAVEPWMSGLGGGGFMLIQRAGEDVAHCVEFGMRASQELNPEDYPLRAGGEDADLFSWPAVVDDRNVRGPLSVAVPGMVKGHALALSTFGTRSWEQSIRPGLELAEAGMDVDWYATLKIASEARSIMTDEECARTYLPGGFAPAGSWGGPIPHIKLGALAGTYRRLLEAGPEDFYHGELAASICADAARLGVRITPQDLATYEAKVTPVQPTPYRDASVFAAPGLSAGPTLLDALERLSQRWSAGDGGGAPDAGAYTAYASSLREAYTLRLETLGDVDDGAQAATGPSPACTTHMSVVDAQGNFVALTQTLLSIFGSKVMLPETGMLMNNGIMWFDPRPGRPNSMAPGKRPLSNMCPTVLRCPDGWSVALGASGGRRIMPAVFQLLSFLVDYGMDVGEAMHTPRLDVSGEAATLANRHLPQDVLSALAAAGDTLTVQHGVHPVLFACPNVVSRNQSEGQSKGAAYINSPWSKVAAG